MRNRRAQEDEIKVIRSRKRQQESLLDELVHIITCHYISY